MDNLDTMEKVVVINSICAALMMVLVNTERWGHGGGAGATICSAAYGAI